jgi:NAD(P)H-hydrate epimerase
VKAPVTLHAALVESWLPSRPEEGHKGTFGKVCILAGSLGFTGASVLASRAAVRGGTGLVFVLVPEQVYPIIAVKCDEAMPSPLPSRGGVLSRQALLPALEKLEGCDAALIGPGLGRSEEQDEVVLELLRRTQLPLVLDADGLNALSRHKLEVSLSERCILTPHDGEYQRLMGRWPGNNRISDAMDLSHAWGGAVTVLKGHRTVITDGKEVYLNPTGNAGMAKGGSGDVLAGLMVSLLGQGMKPIQAAAAAVWIHGCAGDLCKAQLGERAMTPSDLIGRFAAVLKPLE